MVELSSTAVRKMTGRVVSSSSWRIFLQRVSPCMRSMMRSVMTRSISFEFFCK